MTTRKPPKLAAWLMKWTGAANDPLAGDLLEEFQSGRSAAWYWRQALAAIVTGVGRDLRSSRRYYGAVTLGFAVQACVTYWLRARSWPHLAWRSDIASGVIMLAAIAWFVFKGRTPRSESFLKSDLHSGQAFREQRFTFLFAACANFAIYLIGYILSTTLRPDQTVEFWASNQAIWFFSNLITDLRRRAS
ncbi:MAG TPA: hypothetical protein VGN17_28020 [Bryobacteraceae bacterium]|jgi:hypothetical protein